jgi:transcriptional regulator with XRE-family HTH domain
MEPETTASKRQTRQLQELLLQTRTPSLIQSPRGASRIIENLLEATGVSSSHLARQMDVASQTVNRWRRGEVVPRARQFEKMAEYIQSILEQEESKTNRESPFSDVGQGHLEAVSKLGIHFADSIMALEAESRHVWILKSGALREAASGFMGESVLRALKYGTHYHYVFLAGTPAETSFSQLIAWLQSETFAGSVTGYCLRDAVWAGTLGITQAPGAWIVMEYGDA